MDSSSKDGIIGYSTIDGMTDISTGEEKLVSGSIPVNVTGTVGNEKYLEYIPHPAFEFDGSNAGIWVGKFENSSSLNSITIKPNATLLSGGYLQEKIKAGQDVKNTYGLQSIKDSYMIKNIEWGAVAYIADSKYGRNGTSITACNYGITGGTDYRINEDQSTTGNIYGINKYIYTTYSESKR